MINKFKTNHIVFRKPSYILNNFLTKGDNRSLKVKKNILEMLFYKGGNIVIGLILVPMTINYVNATNYGIWITLSSMVAWFQFFDIGINNGLRNKLTEALAAKNIILAKKYVSSTYFFLILVFLPLMVFLLFFISKIDFYSLLNITYQSCPELILCIKILICYFCVNFVFSTINIIFLAYQDPAGSSLLGFVQQLTTLISIYIMTKTITGSLTNLCVALCIIPIAVLSFFNIYIFTIKYSEVRPSFNFIDVKLIPDLLRLGVQFFVIQIAGIIQFQLVNFIIIRYYKVTDVTAYNIAYKYFSVLTMIWGIITTPIWSAVTDAKAKSDYKWIINIHNKYLKIVIAFIILGIIMLIVSPFIYRFWIGDSVTIEFKLSFFVFLFCVLSMFGSTYCAILNGFSELKIQFYACIFSPFIFISCCYFFIKIACFGVFSIVLASIIANFNGYILGPIQYFNLIKKRKYNKIR